MPAIDALHLKRIFYEDLDNIYVRQYTEAFIESANGPGSMNSVQATIYAQHLRVTGVGTPMPDLTRFFQGAGGRPIAVEQLLGLWRRTLLASETFYVSPDMLDLASKISETMPDEDVISSDLPTPAGFMYMPAGLAMMDIRGRPLVYHAVIWLSVGGGVDVYWMSDKRDMRDAISKLLLSQHGQDWMNQLPRLTLAHASRITYGQPLPRTLSTTTMIEHPEDIHFIEGPDGQISVFTPEPMDLSFNMKRDPVSTTLLTIWRLMQQPIVDLREEWPDRHMRKQFRRARLDPQKVTIIELRRREATPHGVSDVEWSHRWMVRGHWRRQPCKDDDGNWITRVIWINPFIKGPEGKPLILRDRVNALVR